MALAAGLTVSVQDTVGSEISFAALAALGQTVPPRALRCVLDVRDMVRGQFAAFHAPMSEGGILLGQAPGLGLTVDPAALGAPVASYAL
jgi:L-alanine-DL-glutamate epimerase-like enolase superfamily enzyme